MWRERGEERNTIWIKFMFYRPINNERIKQKKREQKHSSGIQNSANALILWLNDVFNLKTWFALLKQAFCFIFCSFLFWNYFFFSLVFILSPILHVFIILIICFVEIPRHGRQWYTIFGVSFFGKIIAITMKPLRAQKKTKRQQFGKRF